MYVSLSVPLHYAGYISMIVAAGTVVSSIFSAKSIRRFGTGIVTAVSVTLTAAALIGFSFSPFFPYSFIVLCLCAVPLGLGAGSVDAALNNYVALHYQAKHMSWLHCFWGIGASAGPIIMSVFLTRDGTWSAGYQTIGIVQVCLVIVLFTALPLWGKTERMSGNAPHETTPTPRLAELFRIAGVKQVLIVFFCYCTIESVTGLWGSSYLVMIKNIAPEVAARWIALYYIGITSGRLVSGFLTIKLSNRRMIRLGQCFIACGIVLLFLPLGNGSLIAGFFIIGLGCAPVFPCLLHETPHNFGEEYSQAIMGIQMASAYIGTTLMPPLFGYIASLIGLALFPVFIGLVLILKIIMVGVLNRKISRHDSPPLRNYRA
jgi:fucose permease